MGDLTHPKVLVAVEPALVMRGDGSWPIRPVRRMQLIGISHRDPASSRGGPTTAESEP